MHSSSGVGYLIPEFPSQTHTFIWREIEELRKQGVDPVLFSTRPPRFGPPPHAFVDEALPATTYLYPPPWIRCLFTLLLHPLGLLRLIGIWFCLEGKFKARLRALGLILFAANLLLQCRRRGVTHLHVHSCADAALVAAYCRILGGPTYSMTLHNPLYVFGPNQRMKWRHASFAIVITQALLREVQELLQGDLPATILVAPMGVDVDRFRRMIPYRPWTPGEPCRIFCCGRINPCKGHDILIEAIKMLRSEGIDARLTIAGEDTDSPAKENRYLLEAHRDKLGLRDYVSLPGVMSEEQVRKDLEHAHLFALASHAEPLGVVLMEAMAMETPVVATAAGGVGELIVSGQSGLLVAPGDPAALAAGIREMLSQPERAMHMIAAGREAVVQRFNSALSAAAILQGLRKVRSGPTDARTSGATGERVEDGANASTNASSSTANTVKM